LQNALQRVLARPPRANILPRNHRFRFSAVKLSELIHMTRAT